MLYSIHNWNSLGLKIFFVCVLKFLNLWNKVIVNILMSILHFNWLIFFFRKKFFGFFACLVISDLIPDITNFILLDTRYFCIPVNIFSVLFWKQWSYLESIWSFRVLKFGWQVQSHVWLVLIVPCCWGRTLLLLSVPWIIKFSSMASG